MKILNEKGLTHYANSGAPADKEGYLHKKGEVNKGFQKRWFVLKGNLLFYYEKKGEKDPLGVIILEGCTIELAEDTENFMFMVKFASLASRVYFMSARSQESMEAWMKALSCAGYEYMRLIVTELQSKLEEASNTAEANLVQAAARDSQILGRMSGLSCDNRSSNAGSKVSSFSELQKRVNPFDSLEIPSEMDPGDAFRPMTKISTVEIVTWQILQIQTFAEMHEIVRQQIIEFAKENYIF